MNTIIKSNPYIFKLIKKLFLFSIPLLIVGIFSISILYISGEIVNIDKVVLNQSTNNDAITFGQAYSYQPKYYKLKMTQSLKPDVLVVGSSRAMQFKSYMFHDSLQFYNAGGSVNKIRHLNLFISKIQEEHLPKQIVLSIDPWWFNESWDDLITKQADIDLDKQINPIKIVLKSWKSIFFDMEESKIKIHKLFDNKNNIGLSAKMKNEGFQNDGSYNYGFVDYEINLKQRSTDDILDCENFDDRFLPCKKINQKAIDELIKFIHYCKLKKINVIGLIAPFPSFINKHIKDNESVYNNFTRLAPTLRFIFEKNDMKFYDFMSLSKNKEEDQLFIDGVHGAPIIYSKMTSIFNNHKYETIREK